MAEGLRGGKPADRTLRVLLADDQEIVRQGLCVILSHQPGIEVVGAAVNGEEAIFLATALQPDLVLMDLKMPVLNGIQATRRIVERFPEMKVVVLTTYSADEWVFDALRAGASGYLLKDSESGEIVQAVRGALAGDVWLDPGVAGHVLAEFNRLAQALQSRPAAQEPLPEPLSERELAILHELAQGKTNREIAESLFLAEGTVKNYVSSIISKLHANDRTQAAILALRRGLARLD